MMSLMSDPVTSARELLATARDLYADHTDGIGAVGLRTENSADQHSGTAGSDPARAAIAEIDALEARLDQPLRVALVGSVKAGKSTLLNGLLGERIAPTDARECTRIVTWYHYDRTPSVRATLANAATTTLPARRQEGRLELDLQDLSPEDITRIDVAWPAPGIQGITLVDTPGVASVSHDVSQQTDHFLLPDDGPTGADAVVYLLRSLHESDARYIRSMHDRTRHGAAAMGAIAVLSRADEIGGGRLDAMLSVNRVVEQLRADPALEGVCETVVPVAGLLGMGATTLRQSDFALFTALAARDPDETGRILISSERFIAARHDWLPEERIRIDLVDRFGMYGIRLALAAVRGGVSDAADLAGELLRRSGLEELRRVVNVHFTQRQSELKAHSAVFALHRLLLRLPVPGSEQLLVSADEHMAAAHTFSEMQLVGRISSRRLDLPAEQLAELERLVGGRGADAAARLGMTDEDAGTEQLLARALQLLRAWRRRLASPLLDRDTSRACSVAERSCERLIASLAGGEAGRINVSPAPERTR